MGTNKGHCITRDGCELAWRTTPATTLPPEQADTLVLLHGWSQSQAMFDRLIPELATDVNVVSYDMRNHGVSGRTDRGARISTLAADLREVLDALGLDRAHLLGHSMGASVIWSYIDMYGTDTVASLIVVDQPTVVAMSPWIDANEGPAVGAILSFADLEGFVGAVMGPDNATVRKDFLRQMLTPDIPEEDFAWLYAENMLLPMPWGARLLQDHALQDWRDVLAGIDVPTLVIGGEVSHVVPTSQEWTASQISGAHLAVFKREHGGAHFPFYEAPRHFARTLNDFLTPATQRA